MEDDAPSESDKSAPASGNKPKTSTDRIIDLSSVDASNIDFNDKGDIINASGQVLVPFGSFDVDDSGNLTDYKGRVLIKVDNLSKTFKGQLPGVVERMKAERMKAETINLETKN